MRKGSTPKVGTYKGRIFIGLSELSEGYVILFANGVEGLFHSMGTPKRFTYKSFPEIGYRGKNFLSNHSRIVSPQGGT